MLLSLARCPLGVSQGTALMNQHANPMDFLHSLLDPCGMHLIPYYKYENSSYESLIISLKVGRIQDSSLSSPHLGPLVFPTAEKCSCSLMVIKVSATKWLVLIFI